MFEEEYKKLPIDPSSSAKSIKVQQSEDISEVCEASTSEANDGGCQVPMEEDSEWTEVKSRRKR